ncbi:TniB family NTP-binding protein [uncultured Deinococcus sp.]|uniref:TniB family NTP-binding protein n=1 Tax=uncultured Deinococcus sp. TaxID=158789 RepID=UPI0025D7F9FC|nr:TniB family NTP-binding protein [uncultured Deinococcus sp.]
MNLTSGAQELVGASTNARIEYIRRRRRFRYPEADHLLKRIEDLCEHQYAHRSLGITVTAEQHQGKTTLLDWAHDNAVQRCEKISASRTVTSIRVNVASEWSLNSLYNACLRGLGAPVSSHGDPDAKFHALKDALQKKQTRLILIDEFHDIRRTKIRQIPMILSGLRAICNLPKITVVLAGLPELRDIIQNDPQLSSRFEHHRLERWSEGQEYYNLLFTLARDLPIENITELFNAEPEVPAELLKLGRHVVGGFSRILTEAACLCLKEDDGVLNRHHLHRAAAKFWMSR